LVYDGSFDGFLCAAFRAIGQDAMVARMKERPPDLFANDVVVVTDDRVARSFESRFIASAGGDEFFALLLVHSSNDPAAPALLLRYIALTLDARAPMSGNVSLPDVLAFVRIRDRVSHEINRFLGFVRFRKAAPGVYYSPIGPDADIVGFIGPHFVDRFTDQSFIIHDVGRGIGFWHDRGRAGGGLVDLSGMPPDLAAALSRDDEPMIEDLWREYFDGIAIAERRNPGLQAKLLPHRYRKHLVEMEGRRA
jgi:probable DNA metabolism protein